MLEIKTGDLFDNATRDCIIMHGCNAQGVMESGFARQVRERAPEAYIAYINAGDWRLGDVIYRNVNSVLYANCVTQEFYGRDPNIVYVSYAAIKKCADRVARLSLNMKDIHCKNLPVHLPLIGGGLGNGARDKLISIFEKAFKSTPATLWIPK
jgi:hypothetical protein